MAKPIKTPLGEIDLDYDPITFLIKNSSIGAIRKVEFEGIHAQSNTDQFAHIVWIVWQLDEAEEKLNPIDVVQGRKVITPVSGQNRVTSEGILIMRDLFPEGEIGDRAYQMAYTNGYNEYKYWMALLRIAPLPAVLEAAGNLLAQYERFDRQ